MEMKTVDISDFGLAAALTTVGFAVIRFEKIDSRKIAVVFQESSGLRDTMAQYWNHKLFVNASEYFHCLKVLKTRMYEFMRLPLG